MLSRFHPGDGKPGSQWAHHPKVVNGLLFRGLRPGRACPLPTHRTAPRPLGRCTRSGSSPRCTTRCGAPPPRTWSASSTPASP